MSYKTIQKWFNVFFIAAVIFIIFVASPYNSCFTFSSEYLLNSNYESVLNLMREKRKAETSLESTPGSNLSFPETKNAEIDRLLDSIAKLQQKQAREYSDYENNQWKPYLLMVVFILWSIDAWLRKKAEKYSSTGLN